MSVPKHVRPQDRKLFKLRERIKTLTEKNALLTKQLKDKGEAHDFARAEILRLAIRVGELERIAYPPKKGDVE